MPTLGSGNWLVLISKSVPGAWTGFVHCVAQDVSRMKREMEEIQDERGRNRNVHDLPPPFLPQV